MKIVYLVFLGSFLIIAGPASAVSLSYANTDTSRFYTRHSYDVLKYKLDIELYQCYFSPYPSAFSAYEQVTIRVDSAVNFIALNALSASLVIDSVGMAGTSFKHLDDTLKIFLDRIYLPGEILNAAIYYRHKDVKDKGFYASDGAVYTDSPPEGARKWLPCWDRPSDKATWELIARVPRSVRLGSNGQLVDSLISGDTISYHWISEIPVSTYLITISSKLNLLVHTKYWHKLSVPNDSIPIRIYYEQGENISKTDTIIPITNFFSQKFGDYPFEKIGFATMNTSFPWGGMENQSMVNLMHNGYSNINLIAHEHSHQWFGDMITCGTWADIWLNEGFGTYCQNLWVEHNSGKMAYETSMSGLASNYLNNNPGWPLYHPEWAIHTPSGDTIYNLAVTYNKGACVLHQLRYVLGDSVFFKILHDYATEPSLRFGNAFTSDFSSIAEKISGYDLKWFFNEWVYAPNHPVYQNAYKIESIRNHQWRVSLIVNQIQTNTLFYKMPLQVRIIFRDSTHTMIEVMNNVNNQKFDFSFSKEPVSLVFDPFNNILLKQASTARLK